MICFRRVSQHNFEIKTRGEGAVIMSCSTGRTDDPNERERAFKHISYTRKTSVKKTDFRLDRF